MYCDKCGFDNWENSKFCRKCGNRLVRITPEEKQAPKPEPVDEPATKSGKNRKTLIAASAVILAALIGGGIFAWSRGAAAAEEETKTPELYFTTERIYTSKYKDEEEKTTRDKYSYYFDGLTVYSTYGDNFRIETYTEDGSLAESRYYHMYDDDDISYDHSIFTYNEEGQRIQYENTYDNVYDGKHHQNSTANKYEFSDDAPDGKLVEVSKSKNGEPVDVDFVLNADNKVVKRTETGPKETWTYEYSYDEDGNQTQYRRSTYENGELTYYSVTDNEYNEDGDLIREVYKSYYDGKLTSTDTTEYLDTSPYTSSYHSVSESTYSDGNKSTSVYDSLTNYAKVEIIDGKIVPAENSSFREMDESELKEAEKLIDKFEKLAEKAK